MSEEQKKLEPNPEHLAKLKEGVEAWNEWHKEQREIDHNFKAQLDGADFSGAQLDGADFTRAQLDGAQFNGAKLDGANFNVAQLDGANFSGAQLKGAYFFGAQLDGADLQDADLTGANLAYTKNIRFSDNKIKNAVITSTTTAPWLTLKKSYTNTMMIFTLAAVFTFFLPYVVNVATWRSVNLAQELNEQLQPALVEAVNELKQEEHTQALVIEKVSNSVNNQIVCTPESCTKWKIWKLILGLRRDWGVFYAVLSVFLIIYNIFRLYLTQQVSILRDSEQATGLTPRWKTTYHKLFGIPVWPESGYQHLSYLHHRFVRIIFWVAIISFAVHSIAWLNDVVNLPNK